jgi:hypothetical protein
MTDKTPENPNLRAGNDIPEPIIRTEIKPDIADSIKDLASIAFFNKPEVQSKYAESIKTRLLSHAKKYFDESDQAALKHYWDFVKTSGAKKIQIVHNADKTITVAFLSENGTDISENFLNKLFLERIIETSKETNKETRSALAELSRGIIPPTGSKLPQNPYQKN